MDGKAGHHVCVGVVVDLGVPVIRPHDLCKGREQMIDGISYIPHTSCVLGECHMSVIPAHPTYRGLHLQLPRLLYRYAVQKSYAAS